MVRLTDRPAMTIAVDLGRKATKTNKNYISVEFADCNIFLLIWQVKIKGSNAYLSKCQGNIYMVTFVSIDTSGFISVSQNKQRKFVSGFFDRVNPKARIQSSLCPST